MHEINPTTPASGDELLTLWRAVCETAPGFRNGDAKGLAIEEADLVRIGAAIEALAADRAARPATGVPPHLAEVLAFLWGEAPLDGVWFGEKHPTLKGNFWWRNFIPRPSTNGEDREVERDSERLDWLDSNNCTSVFKIGDRWYTRAGYQQPHHRARSLRAAIDAAIQSDAARAAGGEEQGEKP